nr:MAG TPA: hypothetical protein [Caudoviricetes sp.]
MSIGRGYTPIGRGYTVICFTFTAYLGGFFCACIKLISFKNNKV